MKRVLITGGAGFIGSNLVDFLLREDPWKSKGIEITVLDSLTYAGSLENLADSAHSKNVTFVEGDVCDTKMVNDLIFNSDAIFHLAAESHVDRSISDPSIFVRTNVLGTQNILEAAARFKKRILLVSTDEVYGSLDQSYADENYLLNPSSPYSASKASSELLALSYYKTFNLDVVITRCSNNYGPKQHPEKLIPLTINRILRKEKIPIYGDGLNVRDWIHVDDHCSGLSAAMLSGVSGRVYNFGNVDKEDNLTLVKKILGILNESEDLIEFVADRPGHDARYAIDANRALKELNWKPKKSLSNDLNFVVKWYKDKFNSQISLE
jgi:dTDP-glucose 4,6-dehydratase